MDIADFQSMCRICHKKQHVLKSLFQIHTKHLVEITTILEYCTSLRVEKEDGLPSGLCNKCFIELCSFYEFKQLAFDSVKMFKEILRRDSNSSENDTLNKRNSAEHSTFPFECVERKYNKEIFKSYERNLGNHLDKGKVNSSHAYTGSTSVGNINIDDGDSEINCSHKAIMRYKQDNIEIRQDVPKLEKPLTLPLATFRDDVDLHEEVPVHEKDTKGDSARFCDTNSENSLQDNCELKKSETLELTNNQYQCNSCGKLLKSQRILSRHILKHSNVKPFECDECGKKFMRADNLVVHKRTHTGEKPHKCDVCSKTFSQYASLSLHSRVHSGERPYMCFMCGKAFSQSVSLTYHIRTHTGETPYQCDICKKGFAHSGNLNIHMRFHRNERPYVCTICGKSFVISSHLTVHVKQHLGDKQYKCPACDKSFVRNRHLKDHMIIHTGEKPHVCHLCSKSYTQKSHLGRHMKSHG